MTAAVYFRQDAYSISGPTLMGRMAAGESFLRGFLRHSQAAEFWVQIEQPRDVAPFAAAVSAAGRSEPVQVVERASLARLSQPGALYLPGPGIGRFAWQRIWSYPLRRSVRDAKKPRVGGTCTGTVRAVAYWRRGSHLLVPPSGRTPGTIRCALSCDLSAGCVVNAARWAERPPRRGCVCTLSCSVSHR